MRLRALILIASGIMLALIQTVILIEQELLVRAQVTHFVQSMLASSFQVPVTIQSSATLRLFSQRATLQNITIAEPHGSWSCTIGTLELRYSLWRLLKERRLHITSILHDTTLFSTVQDNQLTCAPAFARLFASPPQAQTITIDRIIIPTGTLDIISPEGSLKSRCTAHIPCASTRGLLKLWVYDGTIRSPLLPNLHGIGLFYEYDASGKRTKGELRLHSRPTLSTAPLISEQTLILTAQGNGSEWLAQLRDDTGTFNGTLSLSHTEDRLHGALHGPLALCTQLCAPHTPRCKGDLHTTITGKASDLWNSLQIDSTITNWHCASFAGSRAEVSARLHNALPELTARLWFGSTIPTIRLLAQHNAHQPAGYQIDITNEDHYPLPLGYALEPGAATLHLQVAPTQEIDATYKAIVSHKAHGTGGPEQLQITGTATYHPATKAYTLDARYHDYSGHCSGSLTAPCPLTKLLCSYCTTPFITLAADNTGTISGSIEYNALAHIAKAHGIAIPGEGTCVMHGRSTPEQTTVTLALRNANIRIPHIYNMVEGLTAQLVLNPARRTLMLQNLELSLHRGKLLISEMIAYWNANYHLTFCQIPWIMRECLVSWGKDIFAEFSGAGSVQYTPSFGARIEGTIGIDRMHMRSNIFSPEMGEQLALHKPTPPPYTTASPGLENAGKEPTKDTACPSSASTTSATPSIELALHCITRKPLSIQTSFLDAHALCTASLQGTYQLPRVESTLSVTQGSFLFPYKPLFITRGLVTLLPHAIDDPLLDVIAENSVQGYRIRMHIAGSAKHPTITFDATPSLPEEQIIGLLWGGAEDGALYLAMSTTIMQSIERLILGPSAASSQLMQSLQSIFRPLGSVRFVPSFTDQSGRGGLRGSLAIEVNDRLRAIIKQNFDLPQDTMLEVEYAISDDARVRAVKDERGDLGGEFEASWKF